MRFSRARVYWCLDMLIGLCFLVEAISGLVLWLVLPHTGFQGGRDLQYVGTFVLSTSGRLLVHDWFAVAMTAGVMLHVILHRRWITCVVRGLWRRRPGVQSPERALLEQDGQA